MRMVYACSEVCFNEYFKERSSVPLFLYTGGVQRLLLKLPLMHFHYVCAVVNLMPSKKLQLPLHDSVQ